MTVIPCASTLCVLNIRSADAKVETMLSDFVQLRAEPGQSGPQVQYVIRCCFAQLEECRSEQQCLELRMQIKYGKSLSAVLQLACRHAHLEKHSV